MKALEVIKERGGPISLGLVVAIMGVTIPWLDNYIEGQIATSPIVQQMDAEITELRIQVAVTRAEMAGWSAAYTALNNTILEMETRDLGE